jgi:hypothetical protein
MLIRTAVVFAPVVKRRPTKLGVVLEVQVSV